MEEFVRYAMACGLCFGLGNISGILYQAKRTRDWLKTISDGGRSHVIRLDDTAESLDLFVLNEGQLMKCVPWEVYSKLADDCKAEVY